MLKKLTTAAGERTEAVPWNDYPRPRLRRKEWLCLNGTWDFSVGDRTGQILVPYPPESLLSGVETPPAPGEAMVCRRRFSVPSSWQGRRVLLRFGAVMREAEVLLNGAMLGGHDQGYLPFSFELTDKLLPGENELTVRCVNDLSPKYPWGKQREKRGGMWYTPSSGIWQTVWLEPVPEAYITDVSVSTGPDWAEVRIQGVPEGSVLFYGETYPLRAGRARIYLEAPVLWSPENPHLYPFTVLAGEDRVESYFALRTLSVAEHHGVRRLYLNGKPYFFNALLDQGYWSDGLYTPASPEAFEADITAMKALGFNALRKHIKVEPERFYYDCDRLGMAVFQDMVNAGPYSFVWDTALPTVGLRRRFEGRSAPDPETRAHFLAAMAETVSLLKEHPSVCLWTIFNEGWGQFSADDCYDRLRALDDTRFIDTASGWFKGEKSDVESLHIYFKPLRGSDDPRPLVISEFGGYSLRVEGHAFNPDREYGYRRYTDRESFVRGLTALYEEEVLPLAEAGLSAAVYTQVSDVEDEVNGLLTFDRRVQKVRPDELRALMLKIRHADD